MKKLICILTLGINSLLFSETIKNNENSTNQMQKEEYKIALDYFKNKNYEKSYEMFSTLFFNDMGNMLINFYLGRSAYETKQYEFAISAYDRILIKEPNNNRVRLELAQTYMMMNLYPQAIKEFENALKGKMPSLVRKKVEANITIMKTKQKKHFFNITALLGIIYDSNINATPNTKVFDIYSPDLDTTLTLENNDEEESSSIYQMATVFSYKYKVDDNFILNNSFTPMVLKYNNHNEKDIHALLFNISPTWFIKKDSKVSVNLFYDYISLGHKSYQKNFSINPTYTKVLSKELLVETGFKLGNINYYQDNNKDAKVVEFQNSVKYSTEEYGLFSFRLNLGKEIEINTPRTDVSQNYYNLFISNSYDFLDNYVFRTSLNYKGTKYKDKDVNFLSRRVDKKIDASISLQKTITKDFQINLGATYTDNNSNHEPYDYDKYTLKTNLLYNF